MNISLEPLRFLLHPVALLAFAAAGQAWLDGAAVRGIVAAGIGVLVAGATEVARSKVIPDTPEVKAAGSARAVKRKRSSWGREGGLGTLELIGLLCLAGIVVLIVLAV